MTRFAPVLVVLAGCAKHGAAPTASDTQRAEAVVNAPDRDARDKQHDGQRKPAQLIVFAGAKPGMHAADLGAGTGYTAELIARSVAPGGTVVAQDSPHWDGDWIKKPWEARLHAPSGANLTHVMRDWGAPLPPEAHDLDLVTFVAAYHDVVAEGDDPNKLNGAVFNALRHGGTYIVIDNSAKPGSGTSACALFHRIDEDVVKQQVKSAGFQLAAESDFMRNPNDSRDWNADPGAKDARVHTQDLFALKFIKP
jgi:predicted methyltransferase